MAAVISYGKIHVQSPVQNSSVCIGETNMEGWDAHFRSNTGLAGLYGLRSMVRTTLNFTNDSKDTVDGAIDDQDIKVTWNINQ
ncbi:hypothetical protein LLE49_10510 [Alicyclobacillus tolerans]|uniref:hypothetical protein n=1 Tax=Alicyclobacillus tolerans TaxID=90970 RepID=UPI001F1C31F9|nr:hypothetical protein [Alicyclobacillus tolerans]MCF8565146.1 hypothetical protein [Alicyclobacillus tolerans]